MIYLWKKQDWSIWVGWVVPYSIGWFLCLSFLLISDVAAVDSLSTRPNNLLPRDVLFFGVVLAILWGIIGLAQSLLLRRYVHQPAWQILWWVLAYSGGWAGFWILTFAYPQQSFIPNMPMVWFPASIGAAFLQWLVLRTYIRQAGWWIVMMPGAIAIALAVVWGINQVLLKTVGGASGLLLLVSVSAPGLISGAITGFFLVFLFNRKRQIG
jgi:hypothetical protein